MHLNEFILKKKMDTKKRKCSVADDSIRKKRKLQFIFDCKKNGPSEKSVRKNLTPSKTD
jgi:hypothetical protein